jgi:predicted DNA-binding transcriptional regulator AlpA
MTEPAVLEALAADLLTTPEAAALLGLPKASLEKARLTAGRGPVFIKLGGRVRYRRQDLISWVESGLRASTR